MRRWSQCVCGVLTLGLSLTAAGIAGATEPAFEPRLFNPLELPAGNVWLQEPDPAKGLDESRDLANKVGNIAEGLAAILNKSRVLSTERFEIRVGTYVWVAQVRRMESKASSDDLRAGLPKYPQLGTIVTRDFKHDFGIDEIRETSIIVNPEITVRWGPSVLRLSWWMWKGGGQNRPPAPIPYGDRVYAAGELIKGDAVLMDSKLIYEYRILFKSNYQIYTGPSFHWLTTRATFDYQNAWGWDDYGCPLPKGSTNGTCNPPGPPNPGPNAISDTERPLEGVPLITLSLRAEYMPVEGIFLTLDTQSMYLPRIGGGQSVGYGYTDTKVGLWVQASKYVRLGLGLREWFAFVDFRELGKHKTNFTGRFEIRGAWAALFLHFP